MSLPGRPWYVECIESVIGLVVKVLGMKFWVSLYLVSVLSYAVHKRGID